MSFRLILSSTIICIFLPFLAYADVYQSTYDHSGNTAFYFKTSQGGGANMIVYQTLGSGLTGSVSAVAGYPAQNNGAFATSQFAATVECFTDSGYTVSCGTSGEGSVVQLGSALSASTVIQATSTLPSLYVLSSGYYYRLKFRQTSSSGYDGFYYGTSSALAYPNGSGVPNGASTQGTVASLAFAMVGATGASTTPMSTDTHIESITPTASSTIATSSAAVFAATGYVNPTDYKDGMFVQMKYVWSSAAITSVACTDCLFTTIRFPITSSGVFSFSTTSPATHAGVYIMTSTIQTPSFLNTIINVFGLGQFATFNVKSSTSTSFIAAFPSQYDLFVASTTASIDAYLASSTVSLASCSSWTGFNLGDCLNLLFVPQYKPISDALNNFKNGFLSYFPWGYVTRFVVIMSGNSTTTLPSISVPLPLGNPNQPGYIANDNFTLDTNDMLQGGADLLDNVHTTFGDDMTFRQVTEPFVELVIGLALLIGIIFDMVGMRHHGKHGRSSKLS